MINIVAPLVILLLGGLEIWFIRRRLNLRVASGECGAAAARRQVRYHISLWILLALAFFVGGLGHFLRPL